jgi:hypothetical protein
MGSSDPASCAPWPTRPWMMIWSTGTAHFARAGRRGLRDRSTKPRAAHRAAASSLQPKEGGTAPRERNLPDREDTRLPGCWHRLRFAAVRSGPVPALQVPASGQGIRAAPAWAAGH